MKDRKKYIEICRATVVDERRVWSCVRSNIDDITGNLDDYGIVGFRHGNQTGHPLVRLEKDAVGADVRRDDYDPSLVYVDVTTTRHYHNPKGFFRLRMANTDKKGPYEERMTLPENWGFYGG